MMRSNIARSTPISGWLMVIGAWEYGRLRGRHECIFQKLIPVCPNLLAMHRSTRLRLPCFLHSRTDFGCLRDFNIGHWLPYYLLCKNINTAYGAPGHLHHDIQPCECQMIFKAWLSQRIPRNDPEVEIISAASVDPRLCLITASETDFKQ